MFLPGEMETSKTLGNTRFCKSKEKKCRERNRSQFFDAEKCGVVRSRVEQRNLKSKNRNPNERTKRKLGDFEVRIYPGGRNVETELAGEGATSA